MSQSKVANKTFSQLTVSLLSSDRWGYGLTIDGRQRMQPPVRKTVTQVSLTRIQLHIAKQWRRSQRRMGSLT